ncbi:MAG: hypothetical protein KF724_11605 [Phycisphaeraceae bacterium]|nr:hypothetical protein [Phycisphaeraceae bacterium]
MHARCTIVVGLGASLTLLAPAWSSTTFHKVASSSTSTVLHGGDRELTSLGFISSTDLWNGSNFLKWGDGSFTNNVGTFGWLDAVPRDMNSSGNAYSGNPDRADNASPFAGEGSGTGTIGEVFGSFNGYKNMSWIIDGEDNGAWTLDLFLANGQILNADGDSNSVELAILERGGNSDLRIRGIRSDGSVTDSIMALRGDMGAAGWTLDTVEISGAQQVFGVGISLDASWQNIIGFRFEAANGMNGPDLVAVGVTGNLIPAPGALALLGLAGVVGMRRRR